MALKLHSFVREISAPWQCVHIIAVVLLASAYPTTTTSTLSLSKPNVLFVTIDDLRPWLGSYGHDDVITPNLDQFSSHAVQFERAYIQQALCGPSRASFMTSRRPDTTSVYGFEEYWRTFSGNFTTIPQYFKQHGYYTLSSGKIFHHGDGSGGSYDYPYSWSRPAYIPPSHEQADQDWECYEPGPWEGEKLSYCEVTMENYPWGKLPDQQVADYAIEFLQQYTNGTSDGVHTDPDTQEHQPFFLGLGFYKPHLPFKAPKEFFELYPTLSKEPICEADPLDKACSSSSLDSQAPDPGTSSSPPGTMPTPAWAPLQQLPDHCQDIKALNISEPYGTVPEYYGKVLRRAYEATITYMDYEFGRVLSELERLGLRENTVITVMGDHGFNLGELDLWEKYTVFETATRVPYMVYVPGVTDTGMSPGKGQSQGKGQQEIDSQIQQETTEETEQKFTFRDVLQDAQWRTHHFPSGRRSSALVEAVDLFPTITQLASLPDVDLCPPDAASREVDTCTEGVSLLPLLLPDTGSQWKSAVFSIYPRPSYEPQRNSNVMTHDQVTIMGYSMRTDTLRYNEWVTYDPETRASDWSEVQARELYLHQSDPEEANNVVDEPENAELVAELAEQLRRGWPGAMPPATKT